MINRLKSIIKYEKPYRVLVYEKLVELYYKYVRQSLPPHKLPRRYLKYQITKAVNLATNLGHKNMSIIEFGVAGGIGLLEIERYCRMIEQSKDLRIEVYGFDLKSGLPPSQDYRDEPYKWIEGSFSMDKSLLMSELERSKVIIGDVKDTVPKFISDYSPAPIGFIVFDLDLYWPTKTALSIFDEEEKWFLPRVECFFDDLFFEHAGEYLAIKEFNNEHDNKKIGQNNRTLVHNFNDIMKYRMFEYHNFLHSDYAKTPVSKNKSPQLPI